MADLLPRHKLVVHATLVQNMGQALRAESRGLWDVATDGWASEVYENDSLVCVCQVSGGGDLRQRAVRKVQRPLSPTPS